MIELPLNFSYNGKVFRYGPKDKLWAVGYEWIYKSNTYRMVHYGDWSQGDKNTWKSYDEKEYTPTFKKKEKEALEEIKISLDIEKEKKNKNCADLWTSEWGKIPDPQYNHSYIESKGLSVPHGTKIDAHGALIIKVIDQTGIVGVQKIFRTEEGFIKRFSTGIKKKGSFAFIGDYKESEYLYMAEGFATAASIHEATSIPVKPLEK